MTLHPQSVPPIPAQTAQVAHAAFPKGNLYIRLRDTLGVFFTDDDFAVLYPRCGHLAQSPWRLALITVMQYVESLSDRQAAEQVRARIDWKYVSNVNYFGLFRAFGEVRKSCQFLNRVRVRNHSLIERVIWF
jgi:transposase